MFYYLKVLAAKSLQLFHQEKKPESRKNCKIDLIDLKQEKFKELNILDLNISTVAFTLILMVPSHARLNAKILPPAPRFPSLFPRT